MKFIDIIRMCLRNLTKHKARTFLTVMGVVIGTCAIIVMISLGIGMNDAQTAMISEWADLTLVEIYNYGGSNPNATEKPADLTDDVLKSFLDIEHVKAVTPAYTNMSSGQQIAIYSGEYLLQCPLIGVYMDQLESFGYKLTDGRFAVKGDPKGTVLMGKLAAANLYNYVDDEYLYTESDEKGNITGTVYLDPTKDQLRIVPVVMNYDTWQIDYSALDESSKENQDYGLDLNVVGTLDGDWADFYSLAGIYIDIGYMKELVAAYNEMNPDNAYEFKGVYDNVRVRVDDMSNVAAVEQSLQDMGYQTSSANEMRENMTKQTQTIQLMLGALAAISLFVAALNITNTMIMSIVERTKEIGVMKVLGCDIGKIRLQFLGEAASIGFLGGLAGIVLSYGVSFILNTFLKDTLISAMGGESLQYSSAAAMDISVIPVWLILAALAFATVVGLLSGFYPANKGVKISALAAISHD